MILLYSERTAMLLNSRDIIRKLEQDGWVLKRVKGSHYHFRKPGNPLLITVAHPTKDMKLGTVTKIYRDAGWEKR
jgi:predicted RNA binding protein YcfA (HicA-like mRNA interferase family)